MFHCVIYCIEQKGGGMMILVRKAKRKTTKFWAKSETSMPPFTLCVQTLLYKKFVSPPPQFGKSENSLNFLYDFHLQLLCLIVIFGYK